MNKSFTNEILRIAENNKLSAIESLSKIQKTVIEQGDIIKNIEEVLEPVSPWFVDICFDANCNTLDISYAGNKHTLEGIFKALRKIGYEPNERPDKDVTYFTTFWKNPNIPFRIYMKFSSTVCHRIKIGTEMIERDVYETRCE